MDRRRFLQVGAAALGAAAGCSAPSEPDEVTPTEGSTPADDAGAAGTSTPGSVGDVDLPVPESELHHGAFKDAIPAITEPEFAADWSDLTIQISPDEITSDYEHAVEPRLDDDDEVIGVEHDGIARAYPLRVLRWVEVVNDRFPASDRGGPPVITYCPLCRSGLVADRQVEGETLTFGVSGLLWRSNLVLYDTATESFWSQRLATAIRGPMVGTRLDVQPFTATTWGEWRATHPDGEVLLPPPESGTIVGRVVRNYDRNPYAGYDDATLVGIGYNDFTDARLHPKTVVVGIADAGIAKAYPLPAVRIVDLVEDRVGNVPVVVAAGPDETLVAYDRRIAGETRSFERADERHLSAAGSRWRLSTGRAVDGPHEGQHLQSASDRGPMFWFSWVDFHPDTALYGGTDGCEFSSRSPTGC